MPRGRKLYYDVLLTGLGPTEVTISPTLTADRHGATLDALPALDGNAANEKRQRQELSVFFNYRTSGDAGFRLLTVTNGATYPLPYDPPPAPSEYRWGGQQVNVTRGPTITLGFSADVDPATVSVTEEENDVDPSSPPARTGPSTVFLYYDSVPPGAVPLVVAVVGSTITITRADNSDWGTGPDPFNPVPGSGGLIAIHLTAGITDVDGNPLANSGDVLWASHFSDD